MISTTDPDWCPSFITVSCVDLHVYIPKYPLLLPVLYSLYYMTVLSWLTCHTVGFYPSCLTPIFTHPWFPVASLRDSTVYAALLPTVVAIWSVKTFFKVSNIVIYFIYTLYKLTFTLALCNNKRIFTMSFVDCWKRFGCLP